MKLLITGGAGFIGSNLIRQLVTKYPQYSIYNLDALTYAGNLLSLQDIENLPNYRFVHADITDKEKLHSVLSEINPDRVIHAAAESHVDRSILSPEQFVFTNVFGTLNLLNALRDIWGTEINNKLFYHISTDEVYGSLGPKGYFTETSSYDPRSPYSASKGASDHFVRSYHHTYGLPTIVSNCSNNYGPYQFPEKLIPLFIQNIIDEKPLPIYGDGSNIRDWLYVQDHVEAIDTILHKGVIGQTYNIGGSNEMTNLDLVKSLCLMMDKKLNRTVGSSFENVEFIADRPGHDQRYAIDSSKLQTELGWQAKTSFETGLESTIDWYLANQDWVKSIVSGDYVKYYEENYSSKFKNVR